MNLDRVSSGRNLPDDFNVIVEIPMNADPIKHEVDKETGALFVDRFMMTAMHYPCNYGDVPHTISDDGDPVDVLVDPAFFRALQGSGTRQVGQSGGLVGPGPCPQGNPGRRGALPESRQEADVLGKSRARGTLPGGFSRIP